MIGRGTMGRKKEIPVVNVDTKIEPILYTFTQTQELLGVSHETLYKLMKDGLPSHKLGHKRVFLRYELVKWIEEH